jgi:hypothetical protein
MTITAAKTAGLIQSYGVGAVFHTDTASFNPATSTTTHTGAATVTAPVVEEDRADRITGEAEALLYASPANLSLVPKNGGRVEYKGRTWTIVSVKPTVYQGAVVLYEIGVKGAAL